jgi:tetratricopeptide (TPR) repeat protein
MRKQILILVGILSFVFGLLTVPARPEVQPNFDLQVRDDFMAGIRGDGEAMKRAMTMSEKALADNPQNAQALVWHGAGIFYQSWGEFQAGKEQQGIEHWVQGLVEMDKAIALSPDDIGVRVPRATAVTMASHYAPESQTKELLDRAIADFTRVYELQHPQEERLSIHAKGELLIGLADVNDRSGNKDAARKYFDKLARELPETPYGKNARTWLAGGTLGPQQRGCLGCHPPSK